MFSQTYHDRTDLPASLLTMPPEYWRERARGIGPNKPGTSSAFHMTKVTPQLTPPVPIH